MDQIQTQTPEQRLIVCFQLWCQAHDSTPARLGRNVINDNGFFSRIDQPEPNVNTATLRKFAAYLVAPANWPDGAVPVEAKAFAHVTGVSIGEPAESAGQSGPGSSHNHDASDPGTSDLTGVAA